MMQLDGRQRLRARIALLMILGGASYVGIRQMKPEAPLSLTAIAGPGELETANPLPDRTKGSSPSLPKASPQPGKGIRIYVIGAVVKPGVYFLPPGTQTSKAIAAAGGALSNADLDAIDLEEVLSDRLQIYVPRKQDSLPEAGREKELIKTIQPVGINSATLEELETLPGVGPAMATKILRYRAAHGRFKTLDELRAVEGMGEKKLARLLPYVTL